MADKKVTIYTTNICPWCIKAKEFFKENNISYKEKNVQENPKLANELLEKSGQMGVPVITVGDSVIIGFNKERVKTALNL
ncbi:MAG: glutaredoxin family protein [Candidatus Nanoarchaeia archaeon]|jgi:glutaredoxin-like YruB-family protein|nr:glutaredoxin family protein [Candidatus Nanoarchaeia archaeon]|tara:strand:+ start:2696 stop:2935 length:240 start_codon:yes stop_codon:yes gene_type:complete